MRSHDVRGDGSERPVVSILFYVLHFYSLLLFLKLLKEIDR